MWELHLDAYRRSRGSIRGVAIDDGMLEQIAAPAHLRHPLAHAVASANAMHRRINDHDEQSAWARRPGAFCFQPQSARWLRAGSAGWTGNRQRSHPAGGRASCGSHGAAICARSGAQHPRRDCLRDLGALRAPGAHGALLRGTGTGRSGPCGGGCDRPQPPGVRRGVCPAAGSRRPPSRQAARAARPGTLNTLLAKASRTTAWFDLADLPEIERRARTLDVAEVVRSVRA